VTQLPPHFLPSLQHVQGFDKEAFEAVHASGETVTSIRINPLKPHSVLKDEYEGEAVPWCHWGHYLWERPSFTFDPFFHAGCYYVQEASSMAIEQAFRQLTDLSKPLKVLDLSAAPGGKSTHIQSLISPQSLLVSNEVIKGRAAVLTDNIIKWGATNVVVTHNDPAHFKKLPGYFDVLVVDAPCSGSGLFRKDPGAAEEWSLNNVDLCCQRQQRILADALPCLKKDGLLIYSTCSYSEKEDEDIGDWLTEEFGMQTCSVKFEQDWGIVASVSPRQKTLGYRFYPYNLKGEGFFMSCFVKTEEPSSLLPKGVRSEKPSAAETAAIAPLLTGAEWELIKDKWGLWAVPQTIAGDLELLEKILHIYYKGVRLGEVMKGKLVPHHALAQSVFVSAAVPRLQLSYEQAILYLQRAVLEIPIAGKGWQLAAYEGFALGWTNVLPNRINNYYPKELRILKQHNNTNFKK
jgi:16S rRNA C967 or C1407 C5-methylase (RsmB/RsmF family)/NOL1/NOP2/fmu family ribosome biogenesis protein